MAKQEDCKKEDEVLDMEWEEHSLEACLAVLGLEAWDMTEPMSVDRLEDEEDWLDGWMKTDEGKRILEEPTKMNGEMEDIALEMESREMDDSAMEQEPGEVDYMTWLLEELRELRVEEDILECVRSMRSMGNCDDECQEDDCNNANCSEWHTGPGKVTAAKALPGWKSNQECEGGSEPGPGVFKQARVAQYMK